MSQKQVFLNNFSTRLTSTVSDVDTVINVVDAVPPLNTDEYYILTLDIRTGIQEAEIVKVTNVSPDGLSLTVERGQESTTSKTWDGVASVVEMRLTSGSLNTLRSDLSQSIAVIEGLLSSDDTTLDELQEVVNFIKANRSDLDTLGIANIAGLQNALNTKVDKVAGKQLSDKNFTGGEKTKLEGIQTGAQVNPGDASTATKGVTQYATGAETATPSVVGKSVTPAGLHSYLGTAASRDVTTSATDTDGNRVVRLTDGDERYGRQLSSNEWSGTNSFHKPLDFWGNNIDFYGVASGANVCGSLATQGSYAVCLTSNGYRSSSDSSWVSYGVDGETGAAEVRCLPSGYVIISAETNKPTGSNSRLTPSLVVTSSSLTFNGNDVYSQPNILGTVSQSGGVPTGAIIERGSNANGEYTKFADGTLICTKGITPGAEPNIWNFPVTFIQRPVVSTAVIAAAPRTVSLGAPTVSGVELHIYTSDTGAVSLSSWCATAIGRWY